MTSLPILLSNGFYPFVKEGDTVKIGDILAKRYFDLDNDINVAKLLGTPAHQSIKCIKKNPGDHIEKGEVIAAKTSFLSEKKVFSNVSGTLLRIQRDTGVVVVRKDASTDTNETTGDLLRSPIDGTVSLCNNEKIVLKTDKNVLSGKIGTGASAEGVMLQIDTDSKSPHEELALRLTPEYIGKIIIGKNFTRDATVKAVGMGIKGVVTSDITNEDIAFLASRNMTLPLVVLPNEAYAKLLKWVGKSVFIDGETKTVLMLDKR